MIRYAFRQLRSAPGAAVVSIFSLALGIGATSAVFSAIYGVWIAPYPYRGADRMVQIRLLGQGGERRYLLLSAAQFAQFRKLDILDGAVAMDTWDMASTGDALPEAVHTAQLSADAFGYFGVPPLVGRTFSDRSELVLSHPFWQRRYGGSAGAIGKVLQLDHRDYTIVGVMPPRFRWGNGDVYRRMAVTSDPDRIYIVDARLRAGVSRERAQAEMQPLLEQFARETPGHFPQDFHVQVSSLIGVASGNTGGTLWLLSAAVGVLLAVGCANVSILALARGTARLPKFAVRAALGAGRRRLVMQMLAESLLLAAVGGAAGVLLAIGSLQAMTRWIPSGTFPPETIIRLNLPVLAFATAVAAITGVLFGIAPAAQFSNPQLHEWMRTSSRAIAGTRGRRMREVLMAGQVALTVLMLAAAGGATRAFWSLYHTRLGYDPHHILSVAISLPDGNYTTYESRAAFYRSMHQHVAAAPGVQSAAVVLFPIPPGEPIRQNVEIGGRAPERGQTVDVQETTGEYFATLGIPLLKGRTWSLTENDRAAHVAVINEEMARRFWPDRDPIGQQIRLPEFRAFTTWIVATKDSNAWMEVIGVVGDTPNRGLREPPAPLAYVPYTLVMGDSLFLVMRTTGDPLTMVHAVREQIHTVDAGQPVSRITTGEILLREEGWAREQFVSLLFLLLAVLTLALAATGLYSVVAYASALRSREFGIRMAVGAGQRHVIGLVMGSVARTVLAGTCAGLVLTAICARLVARWVPGGVVDPAMLAIVTLLLCGTAAIAAVAPARKAAATDPAIVLRAE